MVCKSGKCEDLALDMNRKNRNLKSKNKRGQWRRPLEFVLALVGYAVGTSSIWRFPYLAMRNGGGAFLIPYILFAVVLGFPMVFLESALGQYYQLSPLLIFNICPLFKGIGISITVLAVIGPTYYMVILAWILYYMAMTFSETLPWTTCGNWWNTNSCIPLLTEGVNTFNLSITPVTTNLTAHLSTEEFWQYNVLRMSTGIADLGPICWHLLLPLLIPWVIVYLCIFKGVDSSRIAVYITATAPVLLLLILLAWLLSRPGSADGLLYYITPRWEPITSYQTWLEAFLHVFYSLGPAWGGIINLASYNPFNHNCFRDAVIVTVIDIIVAILCGAVVFAGVGCIAHQAGSDISDSIMTGPGLSFVTYPQVVSTMPLPHLWAIFFFLLVFFLCLDSQFVMIKTVSSGLCDLFPDTLQKRKPVVNLLVIAFLAPFSLLFITKGGMYVFQIVDWYSVSFTILVVTLLECVVVAWIYGTDRFMADIKAMGFYVPVWMLQLMKYSWMFFIPIAILTCLGIAIAKFRPPTYGDYVYPDWTNTIGWILAISSSLPIPAAMIYVLATTEGTLRQRLKTSLKPTIKPRDNMCDSEPGDATEDHELKPIANDETELDV